MAWADGDNLNVANMNNKSGTVFNVKDPTYGAVGDGTTDDTAAIQAAIDAAEAVPGGVVYFPPHTISQSYRVSSSLIIDEAVKLLGSNFHSAGIVIQGFSMAVGDYVLDIDGTVNANTEGIAIENITFMSDDNAPDMININTVSNCTFKGLTVRNCRHGITITGTRTFNNYFENVKAGTTITGDTVLFTAFSGGGPQTFVGCNFTAANGINVVNGAVIDGCLVILGSNFETCSSTAITVNGSVSGLSLFGCRFEKNAGENTIDLRPTDAADFVRGIAVHGCYFETDATSPEFETNVISLGGSSGAVNGFSITGNYVQDYTVFVKQNGDGEFGIIAGNTGNNTAYVIDPTTIRANVTLANNSFTNGSAGQVVALADDATPSVAGLHVVKSGGTTAITDFDDGVVDQELLILAEHSITITDGAPIVLNGSVNYAMTSGDTLTLRMFNDQVWHETARSVN